jgi:hypothetical protein
VCPPPLWSVRFTLTRVVFAQPEHRHRCPVASLCLRRCPVPPAFPLKVSNLPAPLFPYVLHWLGCNCSPEQSSDAVSPLCRGLRSLVPPCRREGHGQVRQTPLIAPKLVPEPLVLCRGGSARLRRTPDAGPSGAIVFGSGPQPLDLGRPSEIRRFRFHLCGSDCSPSIWIRPLSPLPLTRFSAPGPGRSARPSSLTPWPHLLVAPRDLIWAIGF